MMKNTLLIFFFCFSVQLFGQKNAADSIPAISIDSSFIESDTLVKKSSIFDFLSQDEIFEFKLEADFDTLIENKNRIIKFLPGSLSFLDEKEGKIKLKVGLKPRGKYRRKVCDFPPLRLKFKKKGLKKMGLHGKYNSLKLVTHCMKDEKRSKESVLREYLIYKMYNLHAEHSLRAQLVKINYVQSGKGKLFERYGILLEDDDEMAYRTNTSVVDTMFCSPDSLVAFGSSVHSMFQCMIGNADWTLMGMRNVKVVQSESVSNLSIFPYDFDCSGFVNAPYAIPNPDYKLKSTRQRVFLGKIRSDEEMIKVAQHFLERKEATLELCKNFKLLSKYSRKDMTKYLKSFYKIIKDEKKVPKKLLELSPKK